MLGAYVARLVCYTVLWPRVQTWTNPLSLPLKLTKSTYPCAHCLARGRLRSFTFRKYCILEIFAFICYFVDNGFHRTAVHRYFQVLSLGCPRASNLRWAFWNISQLTVTMFTDSNCVMMCTFCCFIVTLFGLWNNSQLTNAATVLTDSHRITMFTFVAPLWLGVLCSLPVDPEGSTNFTYSVVE